MQKDKLRIDYRIPNDARTELRQQLVLRSTVLGGNNRLDVIKIMSFDRRDSSLSLIGQAGPPAANWLSPSNTERG